jgi:AraC-like DNA-binding protein
MDRGFIVRSTQQGSRFTFDGGKRFLACGFDLDLDRILRLFDGDPPAALLPLLSRDINRTHFLPVRLTSLTRSIGASLFALDLHGPLRTIMQEGAVLQLLAVLTAAAGDAGQTQGLNLAVPPRDKDALHHARDRLLANIAAPPTLAELAQTVNMTERRLNQGFKTLFGSTVFETLRNERLDHARLVLESGAISVKEVADRVGYSHVSNFVSAFKTRYGVTPRRYSQASDGKEV